MTTDNEDGEETEKRHERRHRTFKGGRVVLSHSSTIDCIIRDMSHDGALIEISESVPLPDHFELFLTDSEMICRAEVRWQHGRQAGLHLLGEFHPSVRKFGH